MRRRDCLPRVYPMPGRGRHGSYPRATWRQTFGALWEMVGLFAVWNAVEPTAPLDL